MQSGLLLYTSTPAATAASHFLTAWCNSPLHLFNACSIHWAPAMLGTSVRTWPPGFSQACTRQRACKGPAQPALARQGLARTTTTSHGVGCRATRLVHNRTWMACVWSALATFDRTSSSPHATPTSIPGVLPGLSLVHRCCWRIWHSWGVRAMHKARQPGLLHLSQAPSTCATTDACNVLDFNPAPPSGLGSEAGAQRGSSASGASIGGGWSCRCCQAAWVDTVKFSSAAWASVTSAPASAFCRP
mmetsp:Transcript_17035/g.30403  ORF Transcript_17035/g.30403 Transcript_17035/m.30403 type:complete len:245 (-) Transcript_17035:1526-2260(-)